MLKDNDIESVHVEITSIIHLNPRELFINPVSILTAGGNNEIAIGGELGAFGVGGKFVVSCLFSIAVCIIFVFEPVSGHVFLGPFLLLEVVDDLNFVVDDLLSDSILMFFLKLLYQHLNEYLV